jgi:hypothetical protein
MEFLLIWLPVNVIIGYMLGVEKKQAGMAILICVLLGPIGWMFCILSKGNGKHCPKCDEQVQPKALVCRYCGHEFKPEFGRNR